MSPEGQQFRHIDSSSSPRRIPKLTYRNRIPKSDPLNQSEYNNSQFETRELGESFPSAHIDDPSGDGIPFYSKSRSEVPSTTSSIVSRMSSSNKIALADSSISATSIESKRKKRDTFRELLTLKDPSTAALNEFRKQAKQKQAAVNATRATPIGLQGVSSQKLPSKVPKVNSKWDGMPSTLKEKGKESKVSKRGSHPTKASHVSGSSISSLTGLIPRTSIGSGESVGPLSRQTTNTTRPQTSDGPQLPAVYELGTESHKDSQSSSSLTHLPSISRPMISSESQTPSYRVQQWQMAVESEEKLAEHDTSSSLHTHDSIISHSNASLPCPVQSLDESQERSNLHEAELLELEYDPNLFLTLDIAIDDFTLERPSTTTTRPANTQNRSHEFVKQCEEQADTFTARIDVMPFDFHLDMQTLSLKS